MRIFYTINGVIYRERVDLSVFIGEALLSPCPYTRFADEFRQH